MKIVGPVVLGLSLTFAGGAMASAQDAASDSSIPMVLQITREYTKPYRGGAAHDKTESAFVAAFTKGKSPAYYVAMNSQSGRSRALYMSHFNSFADMEKANKAVDMNAVMSAEVERAGLADGENLDEVDQYIFTYEKDLSFHPHNDLAAHRVYQFSIFQVKPGHHHEWEEVVKMVKDAHEKAGDSAHWGMYEIAFGGDDGEYVAITGDPSMSAIDVGMAEDKKFVEALGGEEAMQKLDAMYGDCVESAHDELFTVNPKQSYVPEEWIKADPAFWRPKAAAAMAAKPPAPPAKSGE